MTMASPAAGREWAVIPGWGDALGTVGEDGARLSAAILNKGVGGLR